jgi:type IV secretory pathway VirB10-like protein
MPRLRPFLLALALAGLAAAVGGQSSTANASVPLNAPATGTPVAAPYSPDPGGLEPVQDAQEPRPLGASGAAPVVGNASPTTATPAPAAASSSAEREREREEREAERERERESAPSSKQETEEEREREERGLSHGVHPTWCMAVTGRIRAA